MSDQTFGFRPWVRGTCRKAMIWGVGAVAVLALLAWAFRTPQSAPLGRAFGALVFYGLLFWASLAKIWWTAGGPAVVLDAETVGYQPLHTFRPRKIRFDRILSCAPREGTQSLRLVYRNARRAREFFLNLAVIDGRNEFLDALGTRLEGAGLARQPGRAPVWRLPGWEETPGSEEAE